MIIYLHNDENVRINWHIMLLVKPFHLTNLYLELILLCVFLTLFKMLLWCVFSSVQISDDGLWFMCRMQLRLTVAVCLSM